MSVKRPILSRHNAESAGIPLDRLQEDDLSVTLATMPRQADDLLKHSDIKFGPIPLELR
jgi:hypothetical protein